MKTNVYRTFRNDIDSWVRCVILDAEQVDAEADAIMSHIDPDTSMSTTEWVSERNNAFFEACENITGFIEFARGPGRPFGTGIRAKRYGNKVLCWQRGGLDV